MSEDETEQEGFHLRRLRAKRTAREDRDARQDDEDDLDNSYRSDLPYISRFPRRYSNADLFPTDNDVRIWK